MTHYLLGVVTPAIDTPLNPILAPWDENNEDLYDHVDITEAWRARYLNPHYPRRGATEFEDFVRCAFKHYYRDKPQTPPRSEYACGSGDDVRAYAWRNPNGKWDYWTDLSSPILVSEAVADPDFKVFTLLSGGEWLARGDLGWFAAVYNEMADWSEVLKAKLQSLDPNHYIRFVDCHT